MGTNILEFQSSPIPEDGCNAYDAGQSAGSNMFQSSPSPEARCNDRYSVQNAATVEFQSSPSPEARCNILLDMGGNLAATKFQSSPIPEDGCNSYACFCAGIPRTSSLDVDVKVGKFDAIGILGFVFGCGIAFVRSLMIGPTPQSVDVLLKGLFLMYEGILPRTVAVML